MLEGFQEDLSEAPMASRSTLWKSVSLLFNSSSLLYSCASGEQQFRDRRLRVMVAGSAW